MEFTYTINAKFKYELNVYRADSLPDALYLFNLLQTVGAEWVNVYLFDNKIEDYQQPQPPATPARQCAKERLPCEHRKRSGTNIFCDNPRCDNYTPF